MPKLDRHMAEYMCKVAAAIREVAPGPSDCYVAEVKFAYAGEDVALLTANDFEDFDLSLVEQP